MKRAIHIIRTIAGVSLIVLGAIFGLVPVVQGWVFAAAGIAILGTDHALVKWGRKKLMPLKEKWDRFRGRKPSAAGTAAPGESSSSAAQRPE